MKFYSQNGQDQLIYKIFFQKFTEPGVFIEIGADDGIENSNTFFFEESLNWRGICIEPRAEAYAQLIQNRNCLCENVAIGENAGVHPFLSISGYGKGLSGLLDYYDDRHRVRIANEMDSPVAKQSTVEKIDVQVVRLEEVLSKHAITHIDLCSIDTEGSELNILESIDFSKYHFNLLLIENNYNEDKTRRFLDQHGFQFYGRIGADDIFINRRFQALSAPANQKTNVTKGIPYFRFQEGQDQKLYVFLTGLPPIDRLFDSEIFEWRRFAQKNYRDANCLFLRDPENQWYLHSEELSLGRGQTANLIEAVREMRQIAKADVTVIGANSGGSAALELVANLAYGRAVSFSAQLDLNVDSQLIEKYGETWRLRCPLARRVIELGYSGDLSPILQSSGNDSSFAVIWGQGNQIDDDQHRNLIEKLAKKQNVLFYPLPTSDHNCLSHLQEIEIKALIDGRASKSPKSSRSKPVGNQSHRNLRSLPNRSVKNIIGNTPTGYRWTGSEAVTDAYRQGENSIALISFPRTGSHWLRMLCELYFDRPLLTRSFFKHEGDEFLFWHDHDLSLSEKSQAVIYLYRDPIDTVFSQIKYHNQNFDDPDTILQWTDLYGSHLTKWIYTETFTQRKMIVCYEDLVQDPLKVFQQLSAFCGYRYDSKRAKQVLNRVTKKVVKSKTVNHDPQVQQISSQYEHLRADFRGTHATKIWDRLTSQYPCAGVAFGRLPQHKRPEAATTSNATQSKKPRRSKIIGLVTVRNEEQIIAQCLKALARFTDAIVVLDDASDDSTVAIIKSLRGECNVAKIITKDTWHRDEPGDRNLLLTMGRKLNGTHFIVLDADEMFTANLQHNNLLRNQVLALNPGDSICLAWICLWRSVLNYRYDNSVWSNNYKPFIFADDAQSVYCSDFIHTGRTPAGLKGQQHIIRGYNYGVLHFQFVNWSNLLIKQAWYRCLERIRQPNKPCTDINQLYAPSKDETDLGLREAPFKWFCDYEFFDASVFALPDQWRRQQILAWFGQYGQDYFRELDIWDIDWHRQSWTENHHFANAAELDANGPALADNSAHVSAGTAAIKGSDNHTLAPNNRAALNLAHNIDLLKTNPRDMNLLSRIADDCCKLGRHDDAIEFYRYVLMIDPTQKQARQSIANIIACQNQGSDTAPANVKIPSASTGILVSAIVSTFNAEHFIEGCIQDLMAQTIADSIEIIIIDSGSEQNEAAIVEKYQQRYRNIRYIRTARESVYAAWNRGIAVARGRYITNANADDRHKTDAFAIMASYLDQHPDIALVYADCLITETENESFANCNPVGAFNWLDWNRHDLLFKGCFMGPQPMWRRSVHDEYGLFDPQMVTSGDYEFWLRISQTHHFFHMPQFLGLYLRSPESIEHRNRERQIDENRKILSLYQRAARQHKIIRRPFEALGSLNTATGHQANNNRLPVAAIIAREEFDDAEAILTAEITSQAEPWEAYGLLIDCLIHAGKEAELIEYLRPLIARRDLPAWLEATIGSGFEAAGDLNLAAKFADKAADKDAHCARAWNLQGVLAYRQGNYAMAADHFKKATNYDSRWGDPWTNRGILHWEQNEKSKALDCLEKGLELSPTSPHVADAYYSAIVDTQSLTRALPILQKIGRTHPHCKKIHLMYIDALIKDEAHRLALAEIKNFVDQFGPHRELSEIERSIGPKSSHPIERTQQDQTGGSHLDVGPDTVIDTSNPQKTVALVIFAGPDRDLPYDHLSTWLKIDSNHVHDIIILEPPVKGHKAPDSSESPGSFKRIYMDLDRSPGRQINAIIATLAADTIAFVQDELSFFDGWLEYLIQSRKFIDRPGVSGPMGSFAKSPIQRWDELVDSDGFNILREPFCNRLIPTSTVEPFCFLVDRNAFIEIGGFQDGYHTLQVGLQDLCYRHKLAGYRNFISGGIVFTPNGKREPSQIWSNKEMLVLDQKHFTAIYEAIGSDSPDKARALSAIWLEKSCDQHLQDRWQDAWRSLQKALAIQPDNWQAYHHMTDMILSVEANADIPEQVRSIMTHKNIPGATLATLGNLFAYYGDLVMAAELEEASYQKTPDNAYAHNLSGFLAFERRDFQAATERFDRAAQKSPHWGDPWTNMGMIHWEHGDFNRALDCFEKGFVLSPTAPHVAANYHAALCKTEAFARGSSIFEDAIRRYPRFRKGIHLLIDLYLKIDRTQSAMGLIETLLVQNAIEPGLLDAALAVRQKLGPSEIKADQTPTLSLCMIVKNEAAYLAQCLSSLKPVVDEMIVVDTGSDDQTRSIAAAFGARVYEFDWIDDFAAARNYSLAQANGDWVLVLDADEVIATQDYGRLRAMIKAPKSRKVAFSMVTRNYMNRFNTDGWVANDGVYGAEEKSTGWVPSQKVRLFPNDFRIRFEFPVHEIVDHSIAKAGYRIKQASIPIHHYGKMNRKNAQSKGETYYRIGLKKLEANDDQPKALRELAIQAVELDHFEEAITLWRRLLAQEPSNAKAWTNLSALYIKTGQYWDSNRAALNAVDSDPDRKEGHLNLGVSELYLGNADRSAEILCNLLRRHPDYPSAIFFCGAAQVCASGVSAGLKTFAGLKHYPTWQYSVYAFSDLAKGLHRAGHPAYSQRLLDAAEKLNPGDETLLQLKASLEAGQINMGQGDRTYPEAVCN